MSSFVIASERSVCGKITRSALVTRSSRPPASTIVASDAAMAGSLTVTAGARVVGALEGAGRWPAAPALARVVESCRMRLRRRALDRRDVQPRRLVEALRHDEQPLGAAVVPLQHTEVGCERAGPRRPD